jgi:hypothetical protein
MGAIVTHFAKTEASEIASMELVLGKAMLL